MASNPFSGAGAVFDSLLNKDRDWFDSQSAGTPRKDSAGRLDPVPVSPARSAVPSSAGASGAAQPVIEQSDPARFLNARFGAGWQYEASRVESPPGEVVVLCQFRVPGLGLTRSQFGSARVLQPGQTRRLRGSVDGVPFAMALDGGKAPTPGVNMEQAAYRRAVIDALAKCVETL